MTHGSDSKPGLHIQLFYLNPSVAQMRGHLRNNMSLAYRSDCDI